MISVVIPLYNKAMYVLDAVDSLLLSDLNQILEIIIIDDNSTDNSLDVVKSIDDERIRIISLTENGGPSNARNVGVRLSSFEYVFFLDADDFVHKDLIPVLQGLIGKCNFACVNIDFFVDKNASSSFSSCCDKISQTNLTKNSYHRFLVKNKFVFTASSTMIKKDVFNSLHGFDITSNFTEDAEFWARLSNQYDGIYINETLSFYRLVDGSLSSQFIKGIKEIPILLKTLKIQSHCFSSDFDITNAYSYMLLKYYVLACSTNKVVAAELYNYYVTDRRFILSRHKLVFRFLCFLPSGLIRYCVGLKRYLRKFLL